MAVSIQVRLILVFALALAGCTGGPTPAVPVSTPTSTRLSTETLTAQPAVTLTSAPTLPQPTTAPTLTVTPTTVPTPAPMVVVKEENGWVTYRNEVVGYEISLPESYGVKGGGLPAIGNNLLGPAVPDEEIQKLVDRYYGESLNVWIREASPAGPHKYWLIGIYAYDIIVNHLGGVISPGGVGAYELRKAQETLLIDGQSYPVTFTVLFKHNEPVGELAVLLLEEDGIEFMFGYANENDDPAEYQAYRKEIWPVMRQIIESYRPLPKE